MNPSRSGFDRIRIQNRIRSVLRGRIWFRSKLVRIRNTGQNYLFWLLLWLRLSKIFGSDYSFVTTFLRSFHIKKVDFSCFLGKNINIVHLPGPIQCELWFLYTTLFWPGVGSRSWNFNIPAPAKSCGSLRLRLKVLAPCGSGSTTLHRMITHTGPTL